MKYICSGCGQEFCTPNSAAKHIFVFSKVSRHRHHTRENGWKRRQRVHEGARIIIRDK